MDRQNEEFENLLRQFQLRKAAPLADGIAVHRSAKLRWVVALAALFTFAAFGFAAFRKATMTRPNGTVEVTVGAEHKNGETLPTGQVSPPELPLNSAGVEPLAAFPSRNPKSIRVRPNARGVVVVQNQEPGPAPREGPPEGPSAPPRQGPSAPLPDGLGREIMDRACSTCHSTDAIKTQHFSTRREYEDLVNRMIAFGASVTNTEFPVLIDYLYDNLGTKPSAPQAPTSDPARIIAQVCTACHSLDVLQMSAYDSKDAYKTMLQKMMSQGAGITESQLDPLADYLLKTYGKR